MGFYQPAQLVRDAREHGVEVLHPDVNASDWDCTLEPRTPLREPPSPLVGEGRGGRESRTSDTIVVPPPPNPSPQGGGEGARGAHLRSSPCPWLGPRRVRPEPWAATSAAP
jgi:error-prone DNA polymerase